MSPILDSQESPRNLLPVMQFDSSTSESLAASFISMKAFSTAGRGSWHAVSDKDWNDWRWQLKNRITTVAQLERLMPKLAPEEREGAILAGESKLAMAITPYFFK